MPMGGTVIEKPPEKSLAPGSGVSTEAVGFGMGGGAEAGGTLPPAFGSAGKHPGLVLIARYELHATGGQVHGRVCQRLQRISP